MQRGAVEYPTVIGVRLSRNQAEQVRQIAQADDRPVSAWLRRVISDAVTKHHERMVSVQ